MPMLGIKRSKVPEYDLEAHISVMEGPLAVKGYDRCPILIVLFTLLSIACTTLTVIGCLNFRSNLDLLVYMGK